MLTLTHAAPTAAEVARDLDPAFAIVPLRGGLWRVTRADGEVLGYVEAFEVDGDTRYRAKRVSARLRRFIAVGEFWRMDEAVECFVGN